ncbi:MAG: GHKL domain-containing protein [Sphingobacteriia bacterium]|nr:MAG: GHKL domain-containing protein [Sphingobacteriia bacterium]
MERYKADKELIRLPYSYLLISRIFRAQKNKDSSLFYAKKLLASAQELEIPNALASAYWGLYKSYIDFNKRDSSLKYLELSSRLADSLYKAQIKNLTEYQKFSFNEQFRLKKLDEEKTAYANNLKLLGLLAVLGGILVVAIILYRNIRQKQKANAVLQDQKDKVETTLHELKSTQSQLIQSEKMASLGELTAGIAHEIQNPLNFVNNFSEVSTEMIEEIKEERAKKKDDRDEALQDEILNDIKQNLEKINHHGKRADAIVKGMLQHSRSSSGIKESTNINVLADEYLKLAYHGLRAKDKEFNATMKTDFDETIGNINIIPQDIGRVILNLITNAFYVVNERLKHAQPDSNYAPTVSVSTKKEGNKVFISVQDNGNGIPQKILNKIFQPFFTTKPTGQGTGLGLSLSYDIVKAHGGELKVDTKEGEGSTFSIQIPI